MVFNINSDRTRLWSFDFVIDPHMIPRVSWFSKIDYPIWQFLDEYDLILSRKVIAANIDYDADYTGKRLRKFRDAGLLTQREDRLYEISDLGYELLAGNLSQDELEALDPEKAENGTDEH
ncbi:phage repressor protein [Haladaptatus sp. DYF46]|uniref:phage repressor protein n=1 Tax=Haladaptatus sp. DYF46 TaxID=2886041 RepID=UPI001E4CC0A7|nr:phage repressor protein [Haladaptatus sp. DYF46]